MFSMGGMGGEVRGKTKVATYKKFRAKVNRQRIEERTGLYMDLGNGTKPELYNVAVPLNHGSKRREFFEIGEQTNGFVASRAAGRW
jgi:hypothetical protein